MPAFDLGLINGNSWGASSVDLIEAAINLRGYQGTDAERLALTPSNGQSFYTTDTFREYRYDGTGWVIMSEPVQTVTPTTTNITIGTAGTSTLKYQRSAGILHFNLAITLGTSGMSVGTAPSWTYPVAPLDSETKFLATYIDSSAATRYLGFINANSGTTGLFVTLASVPATLNSITPFTWAASDSLSVSGSYPMLTRYS